MSDTTKFWVWAASYKPELIEAKDPKDAIEEFTRSHHVGYGHWIWWADLRDCEGRKVMVRV